ncbi:MAG: DUF1624 domain-containing protein [Pseudomonadota bacterium]|nr:DUF1624 domain-containing protein [Pseudomonadota bacterium]
MSKPRKPDPSAAPEPKVSVEPIPARRYMLVDMARGVAIALMFIYHFIFDLDYFGVVAFDFNNDIRWLSFRALIVSLFSGLVGVSLVLGPGRKLDCKRYGKRLLAVGACAVLASVGSYFIFPQTFIFFGILHFVFAASVLGLAFLRFTWLNLILGATLIVFGTSLKLPFFDQPPLQWIGMMTHKPHTEDYVPLLPWFGVVLVGMFLARRAQLYSWLEKNSKMEFHNPVAKLLAFGGRHSLIIYMLHQPIFIGLLYIGV